MSLKLSDLQLRTLLSDLHPSRVKTRSQPGAGQLSYLEAHDVRGTLIRVFGFGGFDVEVTHTAVLNAVESPKRHNQTGEIEKEKWGDDKTQWTISVEATTRLTVRDNYGGSAVYQETAVASQKGSTFGDVADFATKTAASDALKRCAVNLGTQFGLSLYNDGSLVEVVQAVYDSQQSLQLKPNTTQPKDPEPKDAAKPAPADTATSVKKRILALLPGASNQEAIARIAEALGTDESLVSDLPVEDLVRAETAIKSEQEVLLASQAVQEGLNATKVEDE